MNCVICDEFLEEKLHDYDPYCNTFIGMHDECAEIRSDKQERDKEDGIYPSFYPQHIPGIKSRM